MIFLCCAPPTRKKILETILSRCQRFDFHRIGNEGYRASPGMPCASRKLFDYD